MKKEKFTPYVPSEKITPEFTAVSVISGIILAVVFGAANAYLGLRVGLTVSASIPAAVISMGVIRGLLKRDSILESNMVQTIGSAGESIAAGAIFTLPALFLWAKEGTAPFPDLWEIFFIALCGGLLGVAFMIPLRNALIVKEHGVLPYPEGTACAEVLLAGENGGRGAASVFIGMAVAAAVTAAGSSSFCFFCAAITAADVDADPDLFLHFPGQRLTPLPFGNSFLLSARLLHPSFFLLLFSHTFHIYLIKSIPLDHKLFVILFHFFTPGHL